MLLMLFMLVIIVGVMPILKRVSEKKITACVVTAKTAFSAQVLSSGYGDTF